MKGYILTLSQEYRTILQHDTKNLRSSLKSVILPVWTSTDRQEYPGQFRLRYRQSEACIYFWRTNHGAEVDSIIEKYGKIIGAFEIKSLSHITGAHLSGLRSFRTEYPDVPLHVIAMVENPYRIEDISGRVA